jgi:hypothetical protein
VTKPCQASPFLRSPNCVSDTALELRKLRDSELKLRRSDEKLQDPLTVISPNGEMSQNQVAAQGKRIDESIIQ